MRGIGQITDYFDYTTGLVRDGDTGQGLPQATIQVVDENGNKLDVGVAADNEGKFRIFSPKLQGNFLLISYVGYDVILVDLSSDPYYAVYDLYRQPQEREPVEVVAKRRRYHELALGSGLSLLGSVLFYGARGSSGSFGQVEQKQSFDWTKLIIPGVVVVGGVVAIGYLKNLGSSKSEENRKIEEDIKKQAEEQEKKQPASYAASVYTELANALYYLGTDPDSEDVIDIFKQMKNTTDAFKLEAAFGTRKYNTGGWLTLCAILSIYCDRLTMSAAMRLILPAEAVTTINNYFASKQINFLI